MVSFSVCVCVCVCLGRGGNSPCCGPAGARHHTSQRLSIPVGWMNFAMGGVVLGCAAVARAVHRSTCVSPRRPTIAVRELAPDRRRPPARVG